MSLILAIEPDRRQAARLTALARGPLNVELVIGDTPEHAFQALGARVPDLVLTPLLLSPKDEAALGDRLRELDAAGAHVQTLVIPVLGTGEGEAKRSGGLFGRLRRSSSSEAAPNGCDPSVFGDQIAEYLERAAVERAALAAAQADLDAAWAEEPPPAAPLELAPAVSAAADDDLEGHFGEFAAIPNTSSHQISEPDIVAEAIADDFTEQIRAQLSPMADVDVAAEPEATAVAPVAQTYAALTHVQHVEEEWEEVSLDTGGESGGSEQLDEIVAEAVDLEAFVLELHTEGAVVETPAPALEVNAPAAMGAPLEATAPFETSALVETAATPLREEEEFAAALFEASIPVEATAGSVSGLDLDDFATALEQVNTPDVISFEPAPEAEPFAAAAEAELEPVPQPAHAPHTAWQDVLSAIRRDIGHLRGDDEPPTPPRPKSSYSLEPLVLPRSVEQTPAPVDTLEPIESVDGVKEPTPLEELLASLGPAEAPEPSVDLASVDLPSVELSPVHLPSVDLSPIDFPPVDLSPVDLPSVDLPFEAVAVSEPPAVVEAYESLPQAIPQPPKPRASKSKKKRRHEPSTPAVVSVHVDEWGFFDPQKVGFGALLSKLNEITDREQRAALPRH